MTEWILAGLIWFGISLVVGLVVGRIIAGVD